MRYTIPAGTYFDIPVKIHFTFPLILIAFGVEAWVGGTWRDGLWAVGLILAVFVCVVLHEFGHSLQVKRYGIPVRDIVLLPIGGMARAERIPEDPRQEIIVAISGPLVNFALALLLFGILFVGGDGMVGEEFVTSLLVINLVLGLFNLVPAFPMDGGRILRGVLATRMHYLRATSVARAIGQVIAVGFVIVGFLNSAFLMLPVIAVFIFFGAMNEENMIRIRHTLEGRSVVDVLGDGEVLGMHEPLTAAERAASAAGQGGAVAVSDIARTVTGAVRGDVVAAGIRAGRGSEPLGRFVEFNFPVLRADMPAIQAYYFLKAEKKAFAGVVDAAGYRGLVFFDRFLERPS
jgi:Zn-dependent protease